MLRLVTRQFQHDPLRTLLTGLALASVVGVILILEGFLEGVVAQSRNAVMNRGADLIVMQAGVKNLTLARSILPQSTRSEVEAVDGVIGAYPLTGIPVIYERHGVRAPLLLLVYDSGGGPRNIVAGHSITGPREIVVDRSFAVKFDVAPGDKILVSDFEFTVAGITAGSAAFFSAFGFARYDDLIDFYFESDLAADIATLPLLSFLLVDVTESSDPAAVAADIERAVPGVNVYPPVTIAAEDEALSRTLLGPIIEVLVAAGYVSGALVMAIIMFAAVNSRRRDFGVLKALGFSDRFLAGTVLTEALVLIGVALPAGLLLAALIAAAIERLMPLYLLPVAGPAPLARTAVAAVAFAVLGALAPVRLLRRLDPSAVFRS